MSEIRFPFTIDVLGRDEDGHWFAALFEYGKPGVAVDRSQGSWRYTPPVGQTSWQELPLRYAVALQERVRRLEKAERKEGAA